MALAPQQGWREASCDFGLVITVMQASESALRQVGLHESAADVERLLRRFLRQRRGRLQGDMAETTQRPATTPVMPRRRVSGGQSRRIPGLHLGARTRQE